MTVKESLDQVLQSLTDQQQQQVLDFAIFLSAQTEREDRRQIGLAHLARCYGPDEPEYTEADIKPRPE